MTVSLYNVWVIFSSLILVTAPFFGTLTGFLAARLFVVLLVAGFFSMVRDAALKLFEKGG
jgi:uncharacterized membrane protein